MCKERLGSSNMQNRALTFRLGFWFFSFFGEKEMPHKKIYALWIAVSLGDGIPFFAQNAAKFGFSVAFSKISFE